MLDLRKKLVERRWIELTPDLATHYLKFNIFEPQRPIKEQHVIELSDKMKDGRFRFGEIAFARELNSDTDVMMNGQHVCTAVETTGITVPAVLEKYHELTQIEMSILFRQFEIRPRSLKDMTKVEAHALHLNWPVSFSSLIVAAAKLDIAKGAQKRYGGRDITNEQAVELLGEYLHEGNHIYNIIQTRESGKHMWRAPIFYVMFMTYRKEEMQSFDFWRAVKTGEYLSMKMPQMQLRDFLFTAISNRTALLGRGIKNREFIVRSIKAWNAFRAGNHTRLQYRPTDNIPIVK